MSWNSWSGSDPLTSSNDVGKGGRWTSHFTARSRGAHGGRGTDPPGLCHLRPAGLQSRTRPGDPPSPAETTHGSQGWDKGHSGHKGRTLQCRTWPPATQRDPAGSKA